MEREKQKKEREREREKGLLSVFPRFEKKWLPITQSALINVIVLSSVRRVREREREKKKKEKTNDQNLLAIYHCIDQRFD